MKKNKTKIRWANRIKRLLSGVLVISMLLDLTGSILGPTMVYAEDVAYDKQYSGRLPEGLVLSTGTYLFDNVTGTGTPGNPNGVSVGNGAVVTIYVEGKNTFTGCDATGIGKNQTPGGAGIYIPENARLVIRGAGSVSARGGRAGDGSNGGNGEHMNFGDVKDHVYQGGEKGYGGLGAGAGIGGMGGSSTTSYQGGHMGQLEIWDTVQLEAKGGGGGNGGYGGRGGASAIVPIPILPFLFVNIMYAGGGGGGGGGGGFPAADIGGGGAVGGDGGKGADSEPSEVQPDFLGGGTSAFTGVFVVGGGGGAGGGGYSGGGGGGNGKWASLIAGVQAFSAVRASGGGGGKDGNAGGRGGGNDIPAFGLVHDPMDPDAGEFKAGIYAKEGGGGGTRLKAGAPSDDPNLRLPPFDGRDPTYGGRISYDMWLSENASYNGNYDYGDGLPWDVKYIPSIKLIYNLSFPGTKVELIPPRQQFNGEIANPIINLISSKGARLSVEACSVNKKTDFYNATEEDGVTPIVHNMTITGNDEVTPQRIIGRIDAQYHIEKADRVITVTTKKSNVHVFDTITFELSGYEQGGNVEWVIVEGEELCQEIKRNGQYLEIKTGDIGNVKVKAIIGETRNYKGYETPVKSVLVSPQGAELLNYDTLDSYVYTGKEIRPEMTIRFGTQLMVPDVDYELSYSNNVDVGEGTITIKGLGRFEGEMDAWFSITPANIGHAKFDKANYYNPEMLSRYGAFYDNQYDVIHEPAPLEEGAVSVEKSEEESQEESEKTKETTPPQETVLPEVNEEDADAVKLLNEAEDSEEGAAVNLLNKAAAQEAAEEENTPEGAFELNQGTGSDQDTDGNQGTGSDQNSDSNQGTGGDQNTDGNQGTGGDQDTDSNQGTGDDQDTDSNQGIGGDQDTDSNQDTGSDQNSDGNQDTGSDQNTDGNQDTGSDQDTDSDLDIGEKKEGYVVKTTPNVLADSVGESGKDPVASLEDLIYTGDVQTSSPGVGIFNGFEVKEGVDYLLSYSEFVNAGKVYLTITGIKNFAGSTAVMEYDILPADISTIEGIKVQPIAAQIYNGLALRPDINITFRGMQLMLNEDYRVEYTNNVDAGTATATIYGMKNFREDSFLVQQFIIEKAPLIIKPDEGQWKYAGAADPEKFTYQLEGAVNNEQPVLKEGGRLERRYGENVDVYSYLQGSIVLDERAAVNRNYTLALQNDEQTPRFEIKQWNTDKEATIEGTLNEDTGWYVSKVKIVPPPGFKISTTNMLEEDTWYDYLEGTDGDSSYGIAYYLRKYEMEEDKGGTDAHEIGLISQVKLAKYKQDTGFPEGRVTLNDAKFWREFKEDIKFKTFFNTHPILVELFSEDQTSGIKTMEYLVTDTPKTKEELAALDEGAWTVREGTYDSFEQDRESDNIVYIRLTDVAGNITYLSTDGYQLDWTKPVVTWKYDYDNVWIAIPDEKVEVAVSDERSGIKERHVDYRYRLISGEETDIRLLEMDENNKGVIEELPDGDNQLIIDAKDNALNKTTEIVRVKKDTVTPLLQLDGDVIHYATEKYISIDAQVGPSGVQKMFVQYHPVYGEAMDENGTWVDISDAYFASDADNPGYTVEENGTYYFYYLNNAINENGEFIKSNIATISFNTIDKAKPEIEMSALELPSKANYPSGGWTNQKVEVSLKNTTKNLADMDPEADLSLLTEFAYRVKGESEWTRTYLPNHRAQTVLFDAPGNYEVEFEITSAAGVTSEVKSFIVNIDRRSPKPSIEVKENRWAHLLNQLTLGLFFNDTTVAEVTGDDDASGIGAISYLVLKNPDLSLQLTEDEMEDFATDQGGWTELQGVTTAQVPMDDENTYVVLAKVYDKAKNYAYVSTDGFMIDKTPPVMIVGKDAIEDFGTAGKWIVEEGAEFAVTLSDSLSGADKVEYTIGTEETVSVSAAEQVKIGNLPEGSYSLTIAGYDKSGNKTEEVISVNKDSIIPKINLKADTADYLSKDYVTIEPIYGSSGLKELKVKFVPEGQNPDEIAWTDRTTDYADGYTVNANGTLYVWMEDNLGRTADASAVYDKIQYIAPIAVIDAIDVWGNPVETQEWSAKTTVRLYNDPLNVKNFVYQLKKEGDEEWTEVPAEDGYASVEAPEGETTFIGRVANREDRPLIWSEEVKITVQTDRKDPLGVLTTSEEVPARWHSVPPQLGVTYGVTEPVDIYLTDLEDKAVASGLASVSYLVYHSEQGRQLKDYPQNLEEIKAIDKEAWTVLSEDSVQEALKGAEGKGALLCQTQSGQEYLVLVRVTDVAGNVTYIASEGISVDNEAPVIEVLWDEEKWITTDEAEIKVAVKDNLSGVTGGTYQVTNEGVSNTETYTCNGREGNFLIAAADLSDGENTITISAADIAGNAAEPKTVTVKVDKQRPVISVSGDTKTQLGRVPVTIAADVGVSGIKKVEVEIIYPPQWGMSSKKVDITNTYQEGYMALQNGTYRFVVTNVAGVSSEYAEITFENIDLPPLVVVSGFTSDGNSYAEGEWTSQDVKIRITNDRPIVGVSHYYYSADGGENWIEIAPVNNQYWVAIRESGEYDLLFKIISSRDTQSEEVGYHVKVANKKPEVTYTKTPETITNQPVKVEVDTRHAAPVEYSFDGGQTYQESPVYHAYHNENINLVVKDAVGNITNEEIRVDNIDRLSPTVNAVSNSEGSKEDQIRISLNAQDAPKTLEFASAGIKNVYLTKTNPYRQDAARAVDEDYVFDETADSKYELEDSIKAPISYEELDNCWIIVEDKAGNMTVSSVRIAGDKPGPENPEDPSKPENPQVPSKPENPEDPANPGGPGSIIRPGVTRFVTIEKEEVRDIPTKLPPEIKVEEAPLNGEGGTAQSALLTGSSETDAAARETAAQIKGEGAWGATLLARLSGGFKWIFYWLLFLLLVLINIILFLKRRKEEEEEEEDQEETEGIGLQEAAFVSEKQDEELGNKK